MTITLPLKLSLSVSMLLSAAIFGFFYAWVCSTMWGLDAADPRVSIAAMQAMNASVRNAVFFPAFFLTPVALGLSSLLLLHQGAKHSARWFLAAALTYLGLGLVLTMTVNVPMNEALAEVRVPETVESAAEIWATYSSKWQLWNQMRTVASGVSFLMTIIGLFALMKASTR